MKIRKETKRVKFEQTATDKGIVQDVEYFSTAGQVFNIVAIVFMVFAILDYFCVFDQSIDDCSEEQLPTVIEHAKECQTNHCYHAVLEMYCGGE
jgi:hypothetical protein